MASSQSILLLHAFDQLVSLTRNPVYLSTASFGEVGEEAYFIFSSYGATSTGEGVRRFLER